MTDLKFVVDYSDLQLLDRKLVDIEKTAKSSASIFEREFNKAERQLKKTAQANQAVFNSILGIGPKYTDAARNMAALEKQLVANDKAWAREEQRIESLKEKYNPLYRALKQYEEAVEELEYAHANGAISTERMSAAVEALDRDYKSFQNGTAGWSNQFVQGANRAGKSLNKFGMYSQQFGYQMSDFLVQVQGGTSAFVAFGQQGAQLFGLISGPWGAALSIGAAAVGVFGASWMRSKEQMEEAETGAKALEERIKSINAAVEEYFRNQEALSKGVTPEELDLTTQVKNAEEALREAGKELEEFNRSVEASSLTGGVGLGLFSFGLVSGLDEAKAAVEAAQEDLARLRRKQLGQTGRELKESLLDSFGSAFDDLYTQLEELRQDKAQADIETALDYFDTYNEMQKTAAQIYKENQEAASKEAAAQAVADFEAAFASQTFLLKVRFQAEEEIFGQSLTPSGKMKPKQSWDELIKMGWTPEDLTRIGMTQPKGKKSGGGSRSETQEEFLAKIQREIELKKESIGVFGEERKIMEEVARLKEQVIKKDYQISEKKLEQIVREERELENQLRRQEELYGSFHSNLSNAMMDLVTGATSVEDAFKQMIFNIVAEIYKQQIIDPIASQGASLLTSFFANAKGNVFSGGSPVRAFASGGVVDSPTMFPMRGNQTGLMGEAGPEAIIPLKRTANGDLGVQAVGNSGSRTEVVVSLSPELIAQVLQEAEGNSVKVVQTASKGIVNASVQAVAKARRQGGSMKAAFGN